MSNRQELYNKIKAMTKEAYILSEMKRLGFWDAQKPQLAQELIEKKAQITQEIQSLSQTLKDPQAALKALHKERMAAALQKRVDTKIQREVIRFQKALAWHHTKQSSIPYLGDAAFYGKNPTPGDAGKLSAQGLPQIDSALSLAQMMGISLNELRFLTYTNRLSRVSHYQRFEIPKKTGGHRLISAPMPRLKRLQYWVLDQILLKLDLAPEAHGFVAQKNILTNAQPHVGQVQVINLDLKDFFPSITYPRIKGLFLHLGYGDQVSTLLSLICSEPRTQALALHQQTYYLASRERHLPQGSPCSPAISNLICRRLDKRLASFAKACGYVYTRYADDLTFSSSEPHHPHWVIEKVKAIIESEGFEAHPNKTHIMGKHTRQEVTGLVVNDKLSIKRKTLKQFRALLFQIERDGLAHKHWQGSPLFLEALRGYAQFVAQVKPEQGRQFIKRINAICKTHQHPRPTPTEAKSRFRNLARSGETPLPHLKTAIAPPPPRLEDLIGHKDLLEAVQAALKPPGDLS